MDAAPVRALAPSHVVALTAYGEARGEPLEGVVAVLQVIRNRVRDRRWPASWEGVCLQPFQFSCWNAGDPNRQTLEELADELHAGRSLPRGLREALFLTEGVIGDRLRDVARGACHYHAVGVRPAWAAAGQLVATIGRHRFYRGVP